MNYKSDHSPSNYEEPIIAESIHENYLEDASELLRAITHHLRLEILNYIDKNPLTNVNSIYNALDLEQSITSQHLRILRLAKLVIPQRNGKEILYSINHNKIAQLDKAIKTFLNEEA